ncbi:histone-like nucleoid-structuring protein Lsr2 [Streptomyces sp. NPDC056944]|uniref:Lsr2 family DNA-binding protein n=1 Tax=Streptomyces sp. NPDC056944 TaxID=3345972 RepID=UPI0036400739
MVIARLREPDDHSPICPPEIRYFNCYYPAYRASQEREATREAKAEELNRQRQASIRKAEEHARLMKDIRAWGPENGFFVGTRGPIPRRVVEAYREAKGL